MNSFHATQPLFALGSCAASRFAHGNPVPADRLRPTGPTVATAHWQRPAIRPAVGTDINGVKGSPPRGAPV